MANKLSAAQAAFKDMKEANEPIHFFNGKVKYTHYLNSLLGITSEPIKVTVKVTIQVKVEVHKASNYMVPEALKPAPTKVYRFNPDGTMAIFDDAWDRD